MAVSETIQKIIDIILKAIKLRKSGLMYFIDPNDTTINEDLLKKIKSQGFDSVAVRVTEEGKIKYPEAYKIKALCDKVGIKFYAWIWDGYQLDYIRIMVSQGIHILLDEETYSMESKIPYLSSIYKITKGYVEFIICAKPQGWDGGQAYETIVKYCDYIMPMLYLGDYLKSTADLEAFVKTWNNKLNGKLWACLESYNRDGDYTPKTHERILNEIQAAINQVKGVAIFRFGKLCIFQGFNIKPSKTDKKTLGEVLVSSKIVAEYIQKNQKVPSSVMVDDISVNINGFIKIMAQAIINISNNKISSSYTINNIADPKNPINKITKGELLKADYLDASKRLIDYIGTNNKMPNYVNTPLGNLNIFNLADMWSRALKYYSNEKDLPNLIYVQSVGTNPDPNPDPLPDDLKIYLSSTRNCQVNDTRIQAKAKELKKADNIFNFVKKLLIYAYYYNTRLGAVNTLNSSSANCCDHSHLLVALCRAAGIPARYRHGSCRFSDGWYGHVWAQIYISGKWIEADSINDNNSLGKITNWDLNSVQIYNTYKELPF